MKTDKEKFLMCRPDYFQINYVINPWMKGNVGCSDSSLAIKQWEELYKIISSKVKVDLIKPVPELPDMVFTANAGYVLGKNVVLSHFKHSERRPEEEYFMDWFKENGYKVHHIPDNMFFEGGGDIILDKDGRWLWAAYGSRSSLESHPFLAKILELEVLSLKLVDQKFYHLDTCFLPLEKGYLLYYPGAFDTLSNRLIENRIPSEKLIKVTGDDAYGFIANAVLIGNEIITNFCSDSMRKTLKSKGFEVIETKLSEFMKAGGSARCLTLNLNEDSVKFRKASCSVSSRSVTVKGQLLDTQIMNEIGDFIISGGGSFLVSRFTLGLKRNEDSKADIIISAPNKTVLENILQKVILMGASLPIEESQNATLEKVVQRGVAPDNFYSSTIYKTQIRIYNKWKNVDDQRMDAVISSSDKTPRCKLIRDLNIGDMVVTGANGVRILPDYERNNSNRSFEFMGSCVSSERHVEVSIEQIAWELKRIKNNNGKIVVVAGPVTVHTGGGMNLAWMVKNGFISSFLGGNAVAVHDIEQSFFGSSLGVCLDTGKVMDKGHRNHIAAINIIRRAGSIKAAVKEKILKSGLFYELVKNKVPFCLAGSIRDDGPLPETRMDLLKAQKEYANLIKGADIILMLSSMLHSIGVGNMTPSGVKIVCVDINSAVITKLTDRGSLESVGIVTDVGLFLSLLTKQLKLKN